MSGDVWLFFHEGNNSSRAHREHVAEVCRTRGWGFQPRRVDRRKSPNGRPLPLIAVDVAAGLYPRIHRQRVAVLVLGRDPFVPLHPKIDEAALPKRHVPLRRFVSYKSLWVRLPPSDPMDETWAGRFASWCDGVHCEGEHDPRCLPLHIFAGDGKGLDAAARRADFDNRYGTGPHRNDERTAAWRMEPKAFHALQAVDQLHVSGFTLRRGCHWDVEANQYRISTPKGLWLVDGHVNVYPDAHVRGQRPSVRQLL